MKEALVSTTSTQFSINWRDVFKGLLIAGVSAALTAIYAVIGSGALPTLAQIKSAAIVGVTAAISYLLKNWLSTAKTVIEGTPDLKVVNADGTETVVVNIPPKK